MRTVLVANIKGGCGKTTLATNLAVAFAVGGKAVALADADRQKSSLQWCALRPEGVPQVQALNWTKRIGEVPKGIDRVIIDAPAAMTPSQSEELIRQADAVLIPVLSSLFDEQATLRFLERIEEIKAIRKQRKGLALVANRIRVNSRATERLETFLREIGHEPAGRIADRAIYGELACQGLSLFDVNTRPAIETAVHWLPLLGFIEETLRGRN